MHGFAFWARVDLIEPGYSPEQLEYADRMKILDEIKNTPAERNLLDPSLWPE
jgi:hypothetical protein